MRGSLRTTGGPACLVGLTMLVIGCRPPAVPSLQFPGSVERGAGAPVVMSQVDRARPALAMVSVVRAGIADDPRGREGLAHLVEHLAHRRRALDGSSWRTQVTATGADWHASTGVHHTTFYVLVPVIAAAEAIEREGERLADPLAGIDEATFERERRLVLEEHGLRSHRPRSWSPFPCVEGAVDASEASLQRVTLADAKRFVDLHYRPQRTTVLLAGDVPAGAGAKFIRAYRQASADVPAPLTAPLEPAPATYSTVCDPPQVSPPEVWVTWALPPADLRSVGVQILAEARLDSVMQGIRYLWPREIRSVEVFAQPGPTGGLMAVRAVLSSADRGPAMGAVLAAQASDLGSRGDLPFWELREQLALEHAIRFEDLGARALNTAVWMARMGGSPADFLRAHEQAFAAVSNGELENFIDAHLQRKQAHIWLPAAGTGPARAGPGILEALVPDPGPIASASWRLPGSGSTPAAPARSAVFPYATAQRRLDSGLTVLAVRRPGSPTASVAVGFPGGHAFGASGVALAAQFAHRPAWRETGLESSVDIRASTSVVSVQTLATNLPRALEWLRAEVSIHADTLLQLGPQWPAEDLDTRLIPWLTWSESRPDARFSREWQAALFGGHRYGRPPRAAQLPQVSKQQLGQWLAGLRQPGNAALVIVSGDDPQRSVDQAAAKFASWKPTGATAVPAPAPLPDLRRPEQGFSSRTPVFVPDPESTHALMALGCRLPSGNLRELARAQLLAWLLEADFWNEVREPYGHSYGFEVVVGTERGESLVSLAARVPPAVLTDLLAKLRQRWSHWAEHGFDPDQLEVVRAGAAAATTLDGATSAELAGHLARWWAWGRKLDERAGWGATLAGLGSEEMRTTAALCRANLVLGVAADARLGVELANTGWRD